MPFVPPPSDWMLGAEAIQHIRDAERRTPTDAIDQLKGAIVHGKVGARLRDPNHPGRKAVFPPGIDQLIPAGAGPRGGPEVSPGTRQNPSPDDWRKAKIRANGALRFRFYKTLKWYAFEVLRENVLRIWPLQPSRAGNVVPLPHRPAGGRPTEYPQVARILDQLSTEGSTLLRGNFKPLADAIRARADKQSTDGGWSDTTLREHVRTWRNSRPEPK
jgi:hypothetical protein